MLNKIKSFLNKNNKKTYSQDVYDQFDKNIKHVAFQYIEVLKKLAEYDRRLK